MRRRTYLRALGTATAATTLGASDRGVERVAASDCTTSNTIPDLECYDTASLLDANYGALTDSTLVAVWAEDTATNEDADNSNDAYHYSDDTPIPVVAVDGGVVGFGAMLVTDSESDWSYGNEEFVLNVWDDHLGGSGTVLWDEGHGQYYDLAAFSEFEAYAEDSGYTVSPTSSLAADLSGADAAVITSPSDSFSTSELDALLDFVANGGSLFLHDQSDYRDYDETENLNDIASWLSLGFRFNDDQVVDSSSNAGNDYEPVTGNFNTDFPYFTDRTGLGLEAGQTYDVTVTSVTDGDTFDVEFSDGSTGEVRVLGIDSPETKRNAKYERIQEWEGLEDDTYLSNWGENAKDYAKAELDGVGATIFFDENEPIEDPYGRLLAYVKYDKTGDGNRDTLYNADVIRKGYARLYDSGLAKHDEFLAYEDDARANARRVWQQSDPDNSSEIRDRAVDDMYVPKPSSIRLSTGAIPASRVPVWAETTATQTGGSVSYTDIPLVGVDDAAGVAMVGGLVIDESYEAAEGFAVDTSGYENFVFLTNLLDSLTTRTGDVRIHGGHGQFGDDAALSAEDAAYYLRYLEGQDVGFQGVNDLATADLSGDQTVVVTPPTDCVSQGVVDALSTFLSNGGSVILLGGATASDAARDHLNTLAADLGSDLRLQADEVTDDTNNLNDDPSLPTTTRFNTDFALFGPYT